MHAHMRAFLYTNLHKLVCCLHCGLHVTPCLGIVTVDFKIRQLIPEAEQTVKEL